MTHAFECSMGDNMWFKLLYLKVDLPVHWKSSFIIWYIDDIPILIFETKNKRKKKIKQKEKKRKEKTEL